VTLVGIIIMKNTGTLSSIYGIIMIMGIGFFVSTFFISSHGDLAEGILVALLLEERLSVNVTRPP